MPGYFSGTNSRAFAWAVWDAEETLEIRGIRMIALYISGELADLHVYWDHFPETDDLAVMFDSTHILGGATLGVSVLDTEGEWTSIVEFVPVKNRATIFGRYDLEVDPMVWWYNNPPPGGHHEHGNSSWGATDVVRNFCLGWNYDCAVNTDFWYAPDVLQQVGSSTVFYVNTHASALAYFSTDRYDYTWYHPDPPPDPDSFYEAITGTTQIPDFHPVLPVRVLNMGDGLPPFNQLFVPFGAPGNPPINLAFLDGCALGQSADEYADGFLHPGENYYSNGLTENQAVCAYLVGVVISATRDTQEAFWGALDAGWTVDEARKRAYDAYIGIANDPPGSPEEWMVIAGDPTTRLRGVYTGTSGRDTRWVRTLW